MGGKYEIFYLYALFMTPFSPNAFIMIHLCFKITKKANANTFSKDSYDNETFFFFFTFEKIIDTVSIFYVTWKPFQLDP